MCGPRAASPQSVFRVCPGRPAPAQTGRSRACAPCGSRRGALPPLRARHRFARFRRCPPAPMPGSPAARHIRAAAGPSFSRAHRRHRRYSRAPRTAEPVRVSPALHHPPTRARALCAANSVRPSSHSSRSAPHRQARVLPASPHRAVAAPSSCVCWLACHPCLALFVPHFPSKGQLWRGVRKHSAPLFVDTGCAARAIEWRHRGENSAARAPER